MKASIVLRRMSALLSALVLALLLGCEAHRTAEHDPQVAETILEVADAVDAFWQEMASSPEDERAYREFAPGWADIESELASLLLRQEIRPLNEHAVEQTEIALELWQELREQHADEDEFSDFEAERSRDQFRRIFIAMARGEQARVVEDP